MSELMFQLIMVFGILLGNALSVIIPYFRKLSEGKVTSFDIKYVYHSIVSFFWQSVLTFPLWVEWGIPNGFSQGYAFVLAIAFGFGGESMQIQILKYIKRDKKLISQ